MDIEFIEYWRVEAMGYFALHQASNMCFQFFGSHQKTLKAKSGSYMFLLCFQMYFKRTQSHNCYEHLLNASPFSSPFFSVQMYPLSHFQAARDDCQDLGAGGAGAFDGPQRQSAVTQGRKRFQNLALSLMFESITISAL